MTTLETRLVKLEMRVEEYMHDLRELEKTSKELRDSLQAIERSLHQIKWLTIGAALVLFANQFGLSKAISLLM